MAGAATSSAGSLQCKLILKPDRFTSIHVFKEFAALVQRAAATTGVGYRRTPKSQLRPEVREVLFLDTGDYHLYNNSFICRRRIAFEDGFAIGDPEIVFKYRSDDMAKAQAVDVRPHIDGKYKIKFKLEIMPLKDRIGGMRRLLSHNVEFGLSQAPPGCAHRDVVARSHVAAGTHPDLPGPVGDLLRRSPTTSRWSTRPSSRSFCRTSASSISATTRRRPPISPCGARAATTTASSVNWPPAFAFPGPADISHKALLACERFFLELQQVAGDWLSLTTTKTGAVYRLKGNPPQAHE